MEDQHGPTDAGDDATVRRSLDGLSQKLDTVAGAVARIAGGHTDLLGHVAEAEARRGADSMSVAQRLEALERQILALGQQDDEAAPAPAPAPTAVEVDLTPLHDQVAELATSMSRQQDDLALSMEVLSRVAEAIERLDARLSEVGELGDDVTGRVSEHTDLALVGVLRLIDERLVSLRHALTETGAAVSPQGAIGGFEAGAVMGAAQAAWNRLEQRLDSEFDDLGRQLQAMAGLLEQMIVSTDDLASRPVVSGDQLRKAATAVKDSVMGAGRSRRDRRGGPRGLGSGH